MEVKLGEAPSPKEEDEVDVVQLVGIDLRRPPAMLRRGEDASMVEEMVEIIHGLRERESCGVNGSEREREQEGALVKESSG